jgi:hypothetical protein
MKFGKFAKYYAVATQGIISIIILTLAGMYIGHLIMEGPIMPAILGFVGMLSGLLGMIIWLLKLQREDVKKKDEESES